MNGHQQGQKCNFVQLNGSYGLENVSVTSLKHARLANNIFINSPSLSAAKRSLSTTLYPKASFPAWLFIYSIMTTGFHFHLSAIFGQFWYHGHYLNQHEKAPLCPIQGYCLCGRDWCLKVGHVTTLSKSFRLGSAHRMPFSAICWKFCHHGRYFNQRNKASHFSNQH